MKRGLLVLLTGLSAAAVAAAQIKVLDMDSIAVRETQSKVLKFNTLLVDGGTLREDGGPREYVFGFRNISQKPVVITKIRTDCSCLRAESIRREIAPGDSAAVRLGYSPHGRSGSFLSKAYVHTSESDEVEAVLTLKIRVVDDSPYPYRMGMYALSSKEAVFDAGTPGAAGVGLRRTSASAPLLTLRAQFLPEGVKAVLKNDCISIEYDGTAGKGEYPLFLESGDRQAKITIRIK
ncbi:MAG: DUF1573 domain-containing protein [Candidatus Cryptobacteroides sp.]